jgi:hypothetical protein
MDPARPGLEIARAGSDFQIISKKYHREDDNMILEKRDCGIEIKLVPYGGGWTDVYLNIGNDRLYFILSNVMGSNFSDLLRVLYFMYPKQSDSENADDIIKYKFASKDEETGKTEIYNDLSELPTPSTFWDVPWKAQFKWDEEGAYSKWELE